VNGEIRRYQLFRDVNTRIATINAEQEARQGQFLCECGQRDCITELTLDLEEFEQVRGEQGVFVVAPGHGVEGVDRFLESRDGYDLVAMEGD
jgi:hypothetical protein